MYPAFLPFQLSRFARTGIWELLLMGAAKKLLKDTRSRVAQWKRAGPITQRSEDQNLALLYFFRNLFLRFFCFNFYLLFPCQFTNLKSFPSLFWNWKSKAAEAKWNQERILVNVGEFTELKSSANEKGYFLFNTYSPPHFFLIEVQTVETVLTFTIYNSFTETVTRSL